MVEHATRSNFCIGNQGRNLHLFITKTQAVLLQFESGIFINFDHNGDNFVVKKKYLTEEKTISQNAIKKQNAIKMPLKISFLTLKTVFTSCMLKNRALKKDKIF